MTLAIKRRAVAMIELIFAIVVIGITMLSAPLLLSSSTQSTNVAFQQESISMIAAHANALMSYAWDEQNTDSKNEFGILGTDSTTTALDREGNITVGMLRMQKFDVNGTLITINASASVDFGNGKDSIIGSPKLESLKDDIDDFHNTTTNLTIANSSPNITNQGDYIDKDINISTTVSYANDASSSADFSNCKNAGNGCAYSNPVLITGATKTNVKFITTTLTSDNVADKNIVLKMFMCNIGTATPRISSAK